MREVSDLNSRLPLREHLQNMKKIIKTINGLDPWWLPLFAVKNLLDVTEGYLALLLSVYILDSLGKGILFAGICKVAFGFVGVMFLLSNISNWLSLRCEAKQHCLYARYHALTASKIRSTPMASTSPVYSGTSKETWT